MYKGELKDFPKEIVERMLEYQVAQGNERDVSVFERNRSAPRYDGGFDWYMALEEWRFWNLVIGNRDFNLFFSRYPNVQQALQDELEAFKARVREAVANYKASEGCSCCRDVEKHSRAGEELGKLLDVEKYPDGSGYNFYKYQTV